MRVDTVLASGKRVGNVRQFITCEAGRPTELAVTCPTP